MRTDLPRGSRGGEASLRILVDADACPVREEARRAAEKAGVEVILFVGAAHVIEPRGPERVVPARDGRDGADFALHAQCRAGDIVVTDDFGLAALVLATGARAVSSRGRIFVPEQMPTLLAMRHAAAKARRADKRTGGPPRLTPADRRRFAGALAELLGARQSRSRTC